MLNLIPRFDPARPPRILFLGAHSDDIEIGCGALALRLVREMPSAAFRWVVFGSTPAREREARASAADFLAGAKSSEVVVHDFPDAFFRTRYMDIKKQFESLKEFAPDLVFTHARHDLHQDHELLSELSRNTFRNHLVFEYEIPKYDADLASPNAYFAASAEDTSRKVELLLKHFGTQRGKHWFDAELFRGLMRIRGAECASPTGYAEGFYARKITL
jgi:LmbE family N-acetylglucosaminyl deacetylase